MSKRVICVAYGRLGQSAVPACLATMRQLYATLRVILLVLLASSHDAVAQSDCATNKTQFAETIVGSFDHVQSVTVADMVTLCSSVQGNFTILARYNCTAPSDCEGMNEAVFDANCVNGSLVIVNREEADYDALSTATPREKCYDCISLSSYYAKNLPFKPGMQYNEDNHCLGKYTYNHRL